MFYTFPCRRLDNYSTYAFFNDAFTPEECEKIKSLYKNVVPATIAAGGVNKEIRNSLIEFISVSEEKSWVFDKLTSLVMGCNDARWRFELKGFYEGIQLTKYQVGMHYDWHIDSGGESLSARKLSIVVQLSNETDYEGGELQFIECPKDKVTKALGSLIIFPSYMGHRVTPVTKGERMSLVAWVSGDSYR